MEDCAFFKRLICFVGGVKTTGDVKLFEIAKISKGSWTELSKSDPLLLSYSVGGGFLTVVRKQVVGLQGALQLGLRMAISRGPLVVHGDLLPHSSLIKVHFHVCLFCSFGL